MTYSQLLRTARERQIVAQYDDIIRHRKTAQELRANSIDKSLPPLYLFCILICSEKDEIIKFFSYNLYNNNDKKNETRSKNLFLIKE